MVENKGFLITIRSQPKHGILYAALKRWGSLDALFVASGCSRVSLCRWINLRSYPRSVFGEGYESRRKRIDDGLREAAGAGIVECWPKEVRDFIDGTQQLKSLVLEQTREVPLPRLTGVMTKMLTYDGDQNRVANIHESREAINEMLKTLSYREREVINLRYGLGDGRFYGETYTLKEVGHIIKLGPERIRQIEAKAIRKLQQPSRADKLVGFVD